VYDVDFRYMPLARHGYLTIHGMKRSLSELGGVVISLTARRSYSKLPEWQYWVRSRRGRNLRGRFLHAPTRWGKVVEVRQRRLGAEAHVFILQARTLSPLLLFPVMTGVPC